MDPKIKGAIRPMGRFFLMSRSGSKLGKCSLDLAENRSAEPENNSLKIIQVSLNVANLLCYKDGLSNLLEGASAMTSVRSCGKFFSYLSPSAGAGFNGPFGVTGPTAFPFPTVAGPISMNPCLERRAGTVFEAHSRCAST